MTRRNALAALPLALLSACGGSAAAPPATPPTSAALFANTNYVHYVSGDSTAEASNLRAALVGMGLQVEEFVGTSSTEIGQALASKSVLIFPDQEVGSLGADLDAAAVAAIQGFTQAGGTVLVVGSNQAGLDLVNALFSLQLTSTPDPLALEPFALVSHSAASTPFAGGPSTLAVGGGEVFAVDRASLPSNARVLYEDASGDPGDPTVDPPIPPTWAAAIVTEIPMLAGRLVLIGWSFHDAAPVGTIDGGWLQVLETAARL